MGFLNEISSVAQAAGNIVGGFLAAESAEKARDDIRDAGQEAVQRTERGAARGIEAIRAGTGEHINLMPMLT